MDPHQLQERHIARDCRWFSSGLLERSLGFGIGPVFVITFDRHIQVEANGEEA